MKSFSESYKEAGVDVTAGYKAVELMKSHVARTKIDGVMSGIGGFGGLFMPNLKGMEEPVLVEKWEQVRDEKGNVVKDPDTGEVQLYKAFYYTVTFKYDRYAYLMQKYSRANNSLAQTAEYLNIALKANGKEAKITEAILTSIASRVKTVTVPDLTTGTPFIDPVTNLPVLDVNGKPVIDPSTCDLIKIKPKTGTYYPEFADELNKELLNYFGVSTVEELPVSASTGQKTNKSYQYTLIIDPTQVGEINEKTCFVFGTDGVGRDMWCRIWSGLGLSMLIGLAVGIFSIVFGICWGAVSGYYGGLIDILMERFTDILVNVPSMIILTLLNLYLGNAGKGSVLVFIFALIMTSWVGIASRTRIQFYRYKNREYVLASRTMGAKDRRLIFKHILPNGIGPLVNSAVSIIPASMRFETSMSYLGIASMSENSIGQIISSASDFVNSPQAYLLVIPSIIFSIIMVSFSVMGLGLRDALNPSLRGS
jgi:ABC-type dipeptide/oligopeptide/nickel transport system permease subunit